jgi:xylulose-5-phosphate/fructose-6-phosphate phosphoketolase
MSAGSDGLGADLPRIVAYTTPFDVAVLNDPDRLPQIRPRAGYVKQALRNKLIEHREYIQYDGKDMLEICSWRWEES